MKRLTHLSFVASLALLVVGSSLLSGCPAGADLEDTGDGVGPSCDVSLIFEESCSSSFCHSTSSSGTPPSGGVDLLSPGAEARVYNQPGTYPGTAASCAPAVPELLVDPNNIDASLIITKIMGTQQCGESMPAGLLLPNDQIECIRNWVAGIIANPPTNTNTGTGGLPGTGGDGTGGLEQNPVGGTGGISGTGATGVGGSGESGGSGGGAL